MPKNNNSGNSSSVAASRGHVRGRVTMLHDAVETSVDGYDRTEVLTYIHKLKDLAVKLDILDNKIMKALWSDDRTEDENKTVQEIELDRIAEYEDKMAVTVARLENKLKILDTLTISNNSLNNNSSNNGSNNSNTASRLRLESAPLPIYSGERDESLEKFTTTFETILSSQNYNEFEKFLLLQKSVRGRASMLLQSLESNKQTYTDAKSLLETAFAAPLMQKYNTVQRLIDVKNLMYKDPLCIVSEMRQISEMFDSLDIDSKLILQFFYWQALPDLLKEQLIQITNSPTPDLDQIEKNVFPAISRYLLLAKGEKSHAKAKSNNFAINVNYKDKDKKNSPCTLCEGLHPYYRCEVYTTPETKIARLNVLKGCVKCGYINHTSDKCKLTNLKCKVCAGKHFPSLCSLPGNGNSNSQETKIFKKKKPQSEVVNTSVVWSSSVSDFNGLSLPTLTARVGDKWVRLMRDTGAQATLISKNLMDKCNFKVLKEMSITINGFNGPKDYCTKLVEVKLLIAGSTKVLTAVVVPRIDVELNVPEMGKLVEILESKGYNLADKLLNKNCNNIKNVDIILGADYSYLNPISTITFGNNNSTLLDTPSGLMIEGNIKNLLSDVHSLPVLNSCEFINYNLSIKNKNCVLNGELVSFADLENAAEDILSSQCSYVLGKDETTDHDSVIINDKLTEHVLDNAKRLDDGRLMMPLMWSNDCQHLLGTNHNLAKQILNVNLKRYSKDKEKLSKTDGVFREQLSLGIIERIDFEQFKSEHQRYSFLPHMSIFRPDKNTTKTRVVYLSNICENNPEFPFTVSHNQAIKSGPNLNNKLVTSLILLKFDNYLLCYDLVKAFSMIAMTEIDQARLLMVWFEDVNRGNFNLVYYKAKRLPFGISCAPSLLMLALYKILIIDSDGVSEEEMQLRKLAYSMLYMDNGTLSTNDVNNVVNLKNKLVKIFAKYKFMLQQFITNVPSLQAQFDQNCEEETPKIVKLFGLNYDRINDTISVINLNVLESADTKRLILQSFAKNFDPLGYCLPLLNRAKVFIHKLQCSTQITWDSKLSAAQHHEWKLISRQINSSHSLSLERFVGRREDKYKLIAFTDASKLLFGVVVYCQNLSTSKVSLLMAKNRVIGKGLEGKSIPSLELNSLLLGVEVLQDLNKELAGSNLLSPVKIEKLELYCDSMICLNWLDNCVNKFSKRENKLSVFVRNRLFKIQTLCGNSAVTFNFISGSENPADQVTRMVSCKQLSKTCYLSGPKFLKENNSLPNVMSVTVPCAKFDQKTIIVNSVSQMSVKDHVIPITNYSSFARLVRVFSVVIKFVHKLKALIGRENKVVKNILIESRIELIKRDQAIFFSDSLYYLKNPTKLKMPNLVKQLNLYVDDFGLLRVRGKFGIRNFGSNFKTPILLSKHSRLATLIISDLHIAMGHSGKYAILTELRKQFYVSSFFSKVKGVLGDCTICKRFNAKPIQLNQSPYKLERVFPSEIPFRNIYIDHFGPYHVVLGNSRQKVYILLITCLYTRAFNLQICHDMTVNSFIKSLQMHVHRYGLPSKITSDSGTTLIAGGNLIADFIKDEAVATYLKTYSIERVEFSRYCKGNSALGSLVESGVKISKKLIYGFMGKTCLNYHDFEFIISDVNHLINKRPVALKEAARDNCVNDVPEPITPEMLLHGYSLPSVNIVPGLQPVQEDKDWSSEPGNIRNSEDKLRKVRQKMLDLYREEFLNNLFHQCIDKKDRYAAKQHDALKPNDIVLIKEKFMKASSYPMAIVLKINKNVLGEVTSAIIKRGDTKEVIERQTETLIPLLQLKEERDLRRDEEIVLTDPPKLHKKRPIRRAAIKARNKIQSLDI